MNTIPDSSGNFLRKNGIMGAKISIEGPERSIYLLTCNAVTPESLIRENGGEIVMKLTSRDFLVTLPFSGFIRLKNNPLIVKIGPVTVDTAKFEQALKMLTKMVLKE